MGRVKGAINERKARELAAAGQWDELRAKLRPERFAALAREFHHEVTLSTTPYASQDSGTGADLPGGNEAHAQEGNPGGWAAVAPQDAGGAALPGGASALLSFVEYAAPDGERWRAERGAELLRDFQIDRGDMAALAEWHALFAPDERAWLVLRRIYTIAPMLGETSADDLRIWTPAELAAKLGVAEENISAIMRDARLRWSRAIVESGMRRSEARRDARPLTSSEIDSLLMRHGFGFLVNEMEKAMVAQRCRDLEPYLEDESARMMARNAIQQELNIHYIDQRIHDFRTTVPEGTPDEVMRKQESLDKKINDLLDRRKADVTAYEATMKALGETPAQKKSIGQKMEFHDCLSAIVEAVQAYRSKEDNTLIDGMFTLAEVELLMRDCELRPQQYRPDVVLAYHQAREHLWEKEYKPEGLDRITVRRLRKGWKAAVEESKREEGIDWDLDEDGGDAGESKQLEQGAVGVMADAPATNAPRFTPRAGGDDVAVV